MAQKIEMNQALRELQDQQEHREQLEATERNRLATKQWWQRPSSSNTMAWVHSGGVRRTSSQDTRRWRQGPEDAIMAQPASTREDTTLHNITVDLEDQMDLSLEERIAFRVVDNHLLEGDTLQGEVVEEIDRDNDRMARNL